MAFQYLFTPTGTSRTVFYFALYAGIAILNAGCTTSINTSSENDEYFYIWEAKITDKNKLVWYYNTKKDRSKNQPNTALVANKKFLVHPDVRPPTINGAYLLEYSKVNKGEEVLDIGTGTGIHAVFAAEKAKRVVATDIYAPAVENAKANAQLHGVEEKIDFRVGDLFGPIKDGEKFDVAGPQGRIPGATDTLAYGLPLEEEGTLDELLACLRGDLSADDGAPDRYGIPPHDSQDGIGGEIDIRVATVDVLRLAPRQQLPVGYVHRPILLHRLVR